MARRRVQFSLDGLASVAATSVGANRCVNIEKCPDGLYNKAYLLTMDNGKEVIAKTPNPNAGIPYYTTASEVASMDFARNILQTPAPHVYAWNARVDETNSVGAEYIVMEKMPGVPLSKVWWDLQPNKKLKILLQVADYQSRWTHTKFTGFGSLYYAKDVDPRRQVPLYVKDGEAITDSQFAIGASVAREWSDEGRANIKCDRGPCTSCFRKLLPTLRLILFFLPRGFYLKLPGSYWSSRNGRHQRTKPCAKTDGNGVRPCTSIPTYGAEKTRSPRLLFSDPGVVAV